MNPQEMQLGDVDLGGPPPTRRELVAAQLRTAARMLENKAAWDSIAWRLADAAFEVREMAERRGATGCGITERTGMGVLLPRKEAAE